MKNKIFYKKFYTKYLVVPGENNTTIDPSEGDIVLSTKSHLPYCIYVDGDYFINDLGENIILPDWKERFGFKKAALYLVEEDLTGNNFWKIIGQVSDGALNFIKKDMRFNETEFTYQSMMHGLTAIEQDVQVNFYCPTCSAEH